MPFTTEIQIVTHQKNNIIMEKDNKTTTVKKISRGWIAPLLIVVVNAIVIAVRWSSLQELLPAHFDLQGDAGGTMPRTMLMFYPLLSAAICLAAYAIARKKERLHTGLIVLASGIALVVLSSTMVTLTKGTMPVFMLAEPVILVAAIAVFIVCVAKAKREK